MPHPPLPPPPTLCGFSPLAQGTLAELQLDYLDLYLMHAPIALEHTGIPLTEEGTTPMDASGNALVSGVTHAETWRGAIPCNNVFAPTAQNKHRESILKGHFLA